MSLAVPRPFLDPIYSPRALQKFLEPERAVGVGDRGEGQSQPSSDPGGPVTSWVAL